MSSNWKFGDGTNLEFKICDSIMGTGKTCAAINYMNANSNKENKFIFITPFKTEVERVRNACKERHFVSPDTDKTYNTKLESLHDLLKERRNIVSTHALFSRFNSYTLELIEKGNYILMLDEVFNVIEEKGIHANDIELLIHSKIFNVNEENEVEWLDYDYDGMFSHYKHYAKNKTLYCHNNTMVMWVYPIEVFKRFKEVFVLTYMFDAQLQRCYYDLFGIKYKYIGVSYNREDGEYQFDFNGYGKYPQYVREFKNKIHIFEDDKINSIGDKETALSSTWYKRENNKSKKPNLVIMRNNIGNVFKNKYNSPSDLNLWTTYLDYQGKLSGKGYTKGFLSCNARATNDYKERKYLAYTINVYYNPFLKNFFIANGVAVNENDYALSEMLQWIWRSAIREGNDIWIYIPSSRMRGLLKGWLEEMSQIQVEV